jgi:hypothetical protein
MIPTVHRKRDDETKIIALNPLKPLKPPEKKEKEGRKPEKKQKAQIPKNLKKQKTTLSQLSLGSGTARANRFPNCETKPSLDAYVYTFNGYNILRTPFKKIKNKYSPHSTPRSKVLLEESKIQNSPLPGLFLVVILALRNSSGKDETVPAETFIPTASLVC